MNDICDSIKGASTVRMAVLTAVLLSACVGPIPYITPKRKADEPAYTLFLWLAKRPLLNPTDALASCAQWRAKGVICRLTDSRQTADVAIETDEAPCDVDGDLNRVLATAYVEGRIVFNAPCFGKRGDFNRRKFRAVMTHEIGHVIGIWGHIPRKCGGKPAPPKHPDGQQVCGIAVMNDRYDEDVDFITIPDGLAFDLHDRDNSHMKPLVRSRADRRNIAGHDRSICAYRTRGRNGAGIDRQH